MACSSNQQSCGAWPAWQRGNVVSSVRRTTSWNTSALVTTLLRVPHGGCHCASLVTSTMLHMLVFSALTNLSSDTKVVALPMLRETFLGQQEHRAKDRRLCCCPARFLCARHGSLWQICSAGLIRLEVSSCVSSRVSISLVRGMHENLPIRIEASGYASMFRALPLAEVPLDTISRGWSCQRKHCFP